MAANIARAAHISAVLLEEGLDFLTRRGEASADTDTPPEAETAARLRKTLQRLGPTFVKFGQMLATRVDLFGEAFVDELGKLHAEVEPFPTEIARELVEAELGAPIDTLFDNFSAEPVAAASIAQVYKARLAGTDIAVAIKVQRPDLETSLLSDLDALMVLSGFMDKLVPPYHSAMVHRIAQEYASRARAEIDFLAEARAIDRFTEVLANLPEFRVPTLQRHLCTPRVLVMEWMEGTKLADVQTPDQLTALGFDPETFCRAMLRLQLGMAYEHGFVHGDTHPGNIILEPSRGVDAPAGQIALIDFGLHGTVPRKLRDKMLEMVFSQAAGRTDDAVNAFVEVFQADPNEDLSDFKEALRDVLSMADQVGGMRDNRITEQMIRGMRVGSRYKLRAQSELFMVVRNLAIVEGIVLRFCPSMDPAREVKDITGAIMRRRLFGPAMQDELTMLLPQLALTLSQRPQLASRLMKLERSFNEAATLGAFLRKEDVIRDPVQQGHALWMVLVAGIALGLGVAIGAAI